VQEDAVDGEQADATAEVAHEVLCPEFVEERAGDVHGEGSGSAGCKRAPRLTWVKALFFITVNTDPTGGSRSSIKQQPGGRER
jgi:hypothetical protein